MTEKFILQEEQDARIDRAYLDGYEQAHREWLACIGENGNVRPENIQRRIADAALVRQNRGRSQA